MVSSARFYDVGQWVVLVLHALITSGDTAFKCQTDTAGPIRRDCWTYGLQRFVDNDRFVDSNVSVRQKELLDRNSTWHFYECSIHDVFLLRTRVPESGGWCCISVGLILAVVFLGIFLHATKKQQQAA